MHQPAPPLVVFDLDGTLVDTAPDLIDTLNGLLSREGMAAVPFDEARRFIGGGARLLIQRGLTAHGRACGPDDIDRLYAVYVDDYAARIAELSRPFPGLEDALDVLAGQGCRFAVCTNKLERLSVKLLEALGLAERFPVICGQDTFPVMKPDPRALLGTIAAAAGSPGCAVMVGDSGTDIATAKAAGVPVVAVDFGYTDVPVASLGPDRVISRYADLPAAVAELLALQSR
ncbi:phosphoglycolate phosphatase [Rhodoplanes roseus]|uniref:Phosphoglycolate phosphatase n=1 Tax=Rhodoplanes roseus TaxID=29409 RepID=A0A327L3T7_9BRAD|nr:phosphoglycolate phosphatase [Rhodoplanes roseus]RAI45067.1 phosphoglycolate phosphatase [Rhodoplanes roseus]